MCSERVFATVIDAPRDEVFAWHARPGAIHRLFPPWQPLRIEAEAASLADGKARLALPGGLTWVARHVAESYDPPRCFVDTIAADGVTSLPARAAVRWRHIHEFDDTGDGRTRMTDRVRTYVPERVLRPMFDYRHRQLADDLAAHEQARAHGLRPMTIAVTGSSGLVGTALSAFLSTGGHRVIRLVRRIPAGLDERRWNPENPDPDLLAGVDAVIHLAGASIAGRFTDGHRRAIRDSRVGPTRRLAELAAATGLGTFVSASAIGFYGVCPGGPVTEESERGDGFLADVVADWEDAGAPAEQAGVRVVRVRTGVVQSPRGGILRFLGPLFRLGLGGRVGDGTQWLSWIGIDDLVDIYLRALWDTGLTGPVNAVAPEPVRNAEYTRTLARVLQRPAVLPVPVMGPRLLLGEQGAREVALATQHVVSAKLRQAGHRFRHPDLDSALRHVLGRAL
ncbi:TIGR01777 family oxidoreductase [Mycolicibacterium goodii]|uniref:TIGR01777 family oxidoreductase n=1 Tax=Mycolicibacterium goodii TaxID=134601 RepID=UPI001F038E18|nr:TIGR01777 family oxidoreductase [Mycolicibacterium goodii]ULN50476.1 TIGR01777 family oxidoreductase [Mycolicibacterium goodii]